MQRPHRKESLAKKDNYAKMAKQNGRNLRLCSGFSQAAYSTSNTPEGSGPSSSNELMTARRNDMYAKQVRAAVE